MKHTDTARSVVIDVVGSVGLGGNWRWAKRGEMGMERDFARGNGCTMQCADDILLSHTLESCMFL